MAGTLLGLSNVIGYPAEAMTANNTRALSAAATWQAFSFVAQGKTLNEVRLWQTAKTGSPIAADITCSLHADSGVGVPAASAIETQIASSIPATVGVLTFAGFTSALTAGTMYWLVVKNVNATPASNFVTINCGVASTLPVGRYASGVTLAGWHAVATLNSGTAWATTPLARVTGPLIKYSDGTYDGAPTRGALRSDGVAAGNHVYGTRARGVKFHGLTSGLTYNVKSVSMLIQKTGSPSALRARIYSSSGTLLGTSQSVAAASITATQPGSIATFDFASAVVCPASDAPYRVVLDQVGAGGDASNYYRFGYLQALDTSTEVVALGPMGGTWCQTSTTDNTAGTISWTDTADEWPPCTIALDSDVPFTTSGGGVASLINGGFIK